MQLVKVMRMQDLDAVKGVQHALGDKQSVVRTPWLARTGWLERYVNQDMLELYELMEKPRKDDEQWLLEIWEDVPIMLATCFDGMKDIKQRLWERILYWLASPHRDVINKDPINVYLRDSTVRTYSSYWQKFLCFCLRVMDLGLFNVNFTERQKNDLIELRDLYRAEGPAFIRRRKNQLLLCSIRFIQQTVYEMGLPVLIYYSGILGYDSENKVWKQPEHYTNILAGLIWCIRVLVLEYTLPTSRRDELGRNELSPLERFKLVRDEFLVEENECPFATLHTLMNYGIQVAEDAVGNTGASWSNDREVLYIRGHEYRMTEWKQFLNGLVEKMETMLGKELLFQRNGRGPDINLWELIDNQSNERVGYYLGQQEDDDWDVAR